jgi:hypothetical protein
MSSSAMFRSYLAGEEPTQMMLGKAFSGKCDSDNMRITEQSFEVFFRKNGGFIPQPATHPYNNTTAGAQSPVSFHMDRSDR